jgi:hypothetical protein
VTSGGRINSGTFGNPTSGYAYFTTGASADTGSWTLTTNATTNKGLVVKGIASQAASLQEWQNSSGVAVGTVDAVGGFYGTYASFGTNASATTPIIIFKPASSAQTADLAVYKNSAATVLGGRNALAQIYTGSTTTIKGSTTAVTAASASSTTVATYTIGTVNATNPIAVGQLVTTTGFTAETYFNGTFAVTAIGGSTGAWTFTVAGTGFTVASATVLGTVQLPAQVSITASSPGTQGLIVNTPANPTVNIQEWQVNGSLLSYVASSGTIGTSARIVANGATGARVDISTSAVGNIGLGVRAVASQTADLVQYQISDGTVRSKIGPNGRMSFGSPATEINSAILSVSSIFAANPAAVFQGVASQTSDIVQFQVTGGTAVSGITPIGQIYTGSATPVIGSSTVPGFTASQTPTGTTNITFTTVATHGISVGQTVVLSGVTPSGYNGTWIAQSGTTGSTLVLNIGSNPGTITVVGTITASAQSSITPASYTTVGQVIKGVASQNGNLSEWQTSTGSVVSAINASGVAAGNVNSASLGIGYMGIPQNSQSASYTLTAADAGKHIYMTTTGQTITIPANSALALPIGTTFTFINPASVSTSIAITTDTMYLAGAGTTGTRTLAAYGMATAVKVTATTWVISGNGLT